VSAVAERQKFLATGEAATLLGCKDWLAGRVYRRGLLAEPARAGRLRLIRRADLPELRRALVAAGYLLSGGLSRP
jgi:hypothetical protein